MAKEKSDLKRLKEDYSKISKKYKLPSFDELNRDFRIERLAEIETDSLIREIRIRMTETLENFLRFIEDLLNPTNVSLFLYAMIKTFNEEDKEKLKDLHKKISRIEIQAMKLINYSEEKEIKLIKKSFELWQEIKRDFGKILENIEKKLDIESKKSKEGYFG